MKKYLLVLLISITVQGFGQDTYRRQPQVDIERYIFELNLSNASNRIVGNTSVHLSFTKEPAAFSLDLIGQSGEFGMEISRILEDGKEVSYTFANNKIRITPNKGTALERVYSIGYSGVAERGLVISTTKFGQRSFFGDNWPTLARHWLPCIDHPYDKAAVEFVVTAPEQYDVVATGMKKEESSLGDGKKVTRYQENAPVPMKVITIGVTKFASKYLGSAGGIPIYAWVYPENRLEGFYDFQVAVDVMDYFISHIGPYSYGKLANMQAKTQWGGLENSGAIAYNENSVTGENKAVGLIAHEIAHQWFGNSASENDWNHVWLSEGFATYFAILYQEQAYGADKRKEDLAANRKQVISYYERSPSPIVNPDIKDPMKVLNTNSYQKGGWVLHMLRNKLGDDKFWEGIRLYYSRYKDSNAMTIDLRHAMEEVSGEDLEIFFRHWVFTMGFPEIDYSWKSKKKKLTLNLKQVQSHTTFEFPIEFMVYYKDGSSEVISKVVSEREERFEIEVKGPVSSVTPDPEVNLLFQDKSSK